MKVAHFRALLFVCVYVTGAISLVLQIDHIGKFPLSKILSVKFFKITFMLENQLLMLLNSIQVHSMHGRKTFK